MKESLLVKVCMATVVLFGVTACVSTRMSDRAGDRLFRQGQYDEAVEHFRRGIAKEGDSGRDALLYLLDTALALHSAGRYEESNRLFLKSESIADIKDYTSLSTEAGTLLTGDNLKDYKGEEFEKVLINTYLAMNFALMGDRESALVEARKVNRKLYLMVTEGGRKYQQNAFARYLSAILYEADSDWNNAYVDYKKTYELAPETPGLGGDLWRMAFLLQMSDEMERWEEKFQLTKEQLALERSKRPRNKQGELIILYENGISPVKRPNPEFNSLPRFFPRRNPSRFARVQVDSEDRGETHVLHDIEQIAIQNLDEKYGGLIAKKLAGMVAKEVVGNQVERATDSPLLGFLTKVVFYAADQADLRSWNLLPRDLQILRLSVTPGTHEVALIPEGNGALPRKAVQVQPGQKVFVNFRYIP